MQASSNRAIRVGAVQMNAQSDVAENLGECRRLALVARRLGASILVLPENFAYFGPEDGKRAIAETLGDSSRPIQRALAEIARDHGLAVIAGGMPEKSDDPDRPYNTCVVFDSAGEQLHSYRKVHLFDVDVPGGASYRESSSTTAGRGAVVVEISGIVVGLSICYDLRFPELYRALSEQGAEVIVVPAAFTLHTGKDHWRVLLRARAIESQAWVVGAAQWGSHPRGRTTYGHSMIIDPWGTVIAEASDVSTVVVADIDRSYTEQVRAALPSLTHRKL